MAKLTLKQRVAGLGPVQCSALLAVVFVGLWILSVPVALLVSGSEGIWATLAAAAAVGIASVAGLAIGELFHGPNEAVAKLLFGMVVRMAVPLIACLIVLLTGSWLANAGFVFYVLAFYLAALPVEASISYVKQSGQRFTSDGQN